MRKSQATKVVACLLWSMQELARELFACHERETCGIVVRPTADDIGGRFIHTNS